MHERANPCGLAHGARGPIPRSTEISHATLRIPPGSYDLVSCPREAHQGWPSPSRPPPAASRQGYKGVDNTPRLFEPYYPNKASKTTRWRKVGGERVSELHKNRLHRGIELNLTGYACTYRARLLRILVGGGRLDSGLSTQYATRLNDHITGANLFLCFLVPYFHRISLPRNRQNMML